MSLRIPLLALLLLVVVVVVEGHFAQEPPCGADNVTSKVKVVQGFQVCQAAHFGAQPSPPPANVSFRLTWCTGSLSSSSPASTRTKPVAASSRLLWPPSTEESTKCWRETTPWQGQWRRKQGFRSCLIAALIVIIVV